MLNPLIAKLEQFTHLSNEDRLMLQTLTSEPVRSYMPGTDIVREGDAPQTVRLILSGWAYRYKQLPDGRRQVIALFLPGDLCDHNVFILSEMDHSIGALSAVTLVEIPPAAFEAMMAAHPRVTRALWWESLVNAAMQREWMLNLGRRMAPERLANLFCEVFYRLRAIGLTQGDSCEMPLTQADLADVIGMTSVHVNRVLQTLRRQQLVELRGRRLTIPDLPALERAALFNPNYLHLDHVGARFDA
ncbi:MULTISPECIES: Crp/Fnr family transcriptional regulator [unclassified Methylobacterium]|uniref:Crp/Fnr family transcriptional regulator n=1 Tax=unclassified Methylobacterium TaxID=2615210 RepID=UPI00226A2F4D|nr:MULTISPECIES: Crp/Fnr family transcriptional regulator [unclassified Methylobacterium]